MLMVIKANIFFVNCADAAWVWQQSKDIVLSTKEMHIPVSIQDESISANTF